MCTSLRRSKTVKWYFLHKVMRGAADKSYGIYVADLAGLPAPLLERAKTLLEQFESTETTVLSNEPRTTCIF